MDSETQNDVQLAVMNDSESKSEIDDEQPTCNVTELLKAEDN